MIGGKRLRASLSRGRRRRALLGMMDSLSFTIRERKPRLITPAGDLWIHRFQSATVIAETSTAMNPEQLDVKNVEYFFFDHRPGPGDVIVDVGAGAGSELLTWSRLVGQSGRVIAIEAHPRTFARLAETKRRNPGTCANVELLQVAIADEPGTAVITDRAGHGANSTVIEDARGISVEALTLDQVVESCGLTRIDHLKMNIEGGERLAIRGMVTCLPLVQNLTICCHDFLAETEGAQMRTKAEVRDWMQANTFEVRERCDESRLFIRDTLYGHRRTTSAPTVP